MSTSPQQMSILDESINSVVVETTQQFSEIMLEHSILDRESGKKSVPRFYLRIVEPYDEKRPLLSPLVREKGEEVRPSVEAEPSKRPMNEPAKEVAKSVAVLESVFG